MKKLKLFLSLLMLICFSVGNVWADATFVSGDEAASSAKNGVSLSVTSGSLASGTYYRIDKGATLTIASTSGNITSIVFTCTTASYAKLNAHSPAGDSYTEDGTTVTWTGSAESVTFTPAEPVQDRVWSLACGEWRFIMFVTISAPHSTLHTPHCFWEGI